MSDATAADNSAQQQAAGPAPAKPPVVVPNTGSSIIVSKTQRGNPVLEHIRNVGKEVREIVADYQVGRTTGVLFLSLRYHRLHPEYIHKRIEELGNSYNLRILLLMCDVSEHQEPIRELTKICLINNITIMVAWTPEEAGFYLSTYKQFEHKPPDLIKERVDKSYHAMLRTALTSISKVNKTDVETLRTSFGSFAAISRATTEQLQNLPGFGQVKAKRVVDALEKPFRHNVTGSTQPLRQAQLSQPIYSDKGKGRARETEPQASTGPTNAVQRPRAPSPVWDMELDLNDSPSPSPTPETGPARERSHPPPEHPAVTAAPSVEASRRKRPPSPVWDIELDLNESDLEEGAPAPSKKPRMDGPARRHSLSKLG